VITSFNCKETEKIWNQDFSKKFPRNIQDIVLRKLIMINQALNINDLRVPPGNRLEKLKGDYKQFHSIRVNQQWRIIFIWENNNVQKIQLIDYH